MSCRKSGFAFVVAIACTMAASVANAQLVLYEQDNFGGQSIRSGNSVPNLADNGFNDRASSIKIFTGQWQVCTDAYFRGRCETLGPGEYPSLRSTGFNNKVSSVRELGWTPDGGGGWGNSGNEYGSGNWGSGARAVLYENIGLKGRSFVVNAGGVPNLKRTGFNNTASSLRIESGYWLFCSEPNYEGDCRTFGPGDHNSMPSGFNDRVSSGRQVSSNYPYRTSPNWNGQ